MKKLLEKFQNYFRKICFCHQKNAGHTISIYAKTRKKFFENSMTPFKQMYEICMTSIFSKTLLISIFGLWRSTQDSFSPLMFTPSPSLFFPVFIPPSSSLIYLNQTTFHSLPPPCRTLGNLLHHQVLGV